MFYFILCLECVLNIADNHMPFSHRDDLSDTDSTVWYCTNRQTVLLLVLRSSMQIRREWPAQKCTSLAHYFSSVFPVVWSIQWRFNPKKWSSGSALKDHLIHKAFHQVPVFNYAMADWPLFKYLFLRIYLLGHTRS